MILGLLALTSVSFFSGAGPVASEAPSAGEGRGVVLAGLRRSPPDGICRGKFELTYRERVAGGNRAVCTHGPDPAPDSVDVRKRRPPEPQAADGTTPSGELAARSVLIPCYGNGSDGYRVQVIYARASDVADQYAQFASSFVHWTAAADGVVSASATETGGTRHFRFVTDSSCSLVVDRVVLSRTGDDDLSNTVSELRSMGYDRTDRKYLVYTDANIYCGIAQIYLDDTPARTPGANASNGHPQVPGTVARVDNGCWGRAESVEAHELMHNLGGVQESAPHATPSLHCTDENDRMCYADGSGASLTYPCPPSHENRFDCNHDDYFSTNPPLLSYLATHWNTADSAFLGTTAASSAPVPPQRTAVTDFDADGSTDVAVFRPSDGMWYVRDGAWTQWGRKGDIPVPGDYDGDRATDIAIFRPSTGLWAIHHSGGAPDLFMTYGIATDTPVVADYDGDGKSDIAIYRPEYATWWVHRSSDGADTATTFGLSTDVPVPADYDGDGKADLGIFRQGTWFVLPASGGPYTGTTWGIAGDIPAVGDYDGDDRADSAVFRPAHGAWYVLRSSDRAQEAFTLGAPGDMPVSGDYDGDGDTDAAVFRPADGTWSVKDGPTVQWGNGSDIPLPLPNSVRQAFFAGKG